MNISWQTLVRWLHWLRMKSNAISNHPSSGTTGSSLSAEMPYLFLPVPDTDFREYLDEVLLMAGKFPEILTAIDADLDRHAKRKKAIRLADKRFIENQTPDCPGLELSGSGIVPANLSLDVGRPRMQPILAFVFLMLRGFLGSLTDKQALRFMYESISLHGLIANLGLGRAPGASTVLENINAISSETRDLILDKQIELVISEGLDDFQKLTIDSTHTAANSAWPTDSRILTALLGRAHRLGQSLDSFGIANFKAGWTPRWLKEMDALDFKIALTAGKAKSKGNRKKHYRALLKRGEKVMNAVLSQYRNLAGSIDMESFLPSRRILLRRMLEQIETSLADAGKVIGCAHKRVLNEVKVPAPEKVLSISDPDAAFINKGNRDPVVGYKPQLVRSGNGFVPALVVPCGNTADCNELPGAIRESINRTGVTPRMVSTDDGYASAEGVRELKDMGVDDVSISGSKGRKLTDSVDWESEKYREARAHRSAVESLVFALKDGFDFGEVRRRGLGPVREELLEKVLAYNMCRIILIRKRLSKERKMAA